MAASFARSNTLLCKLNGFHSTCLCMGIAVVSMAGRSERLSLRVGAFNKSNKCIYHITLNPFIEIIFDACNNYVNDDWWRYWPTVRMLNSIRKIRITNTGSIKCRLQLSTSPNYSSWIVCVCVCLVRSSIITQRTCLMCLSYPCLYVSKSLASRADEKKNAKLFDAYGAFSLAKIEKCANPVCVYDVSVGIYK